MGIGNWTREEHILAFNLYCKTPFTKINARYQPVKELAKVIGRSDGAVAMKLANFARLDPTLKARNISGLTRGAKGEEEVWNEFNNDWERLAFESETLLLKYKKLDLEQNIIGDDSDKEVSGKEVWSLARRRVNQSFFRQVVLASYNFKCCISGCNEPELLNASHIVPWSKDDSNRVNPRNGLCLNAFYDRAFDRGLLTIDENLSIIFSSQLLQYQKEPYFDYFIKPYQSKKITPPQRFTPDHTFLKYHNDYIFRP